MRSRHGCFGIPFGWEKPWNVHRKCGSECAFVVINPKGSLSSDQCWLSLDYRVNVPTGHSALNRGEAGQHTNK